MKIFVQLNTSGSDTGSFMVYSNLNNYQAPAYGPYTKAQLTTGVNIIVPDSTTSVKIRNNGKCTNSIILNIPGAVPPSPVIVPICLTYAAVGGCAASCGLECSNYYASSQCANYITTNAAPAPLGCVIYTDALGTIPAPDGFYSRPGGLCYILGSSYNNGEITGITSCP